MGTLWKPQKKTAFSFWRDSTYKGKSRLLQPTIDHATYLIFSVFQISFVRGFLCISEFFSSQIAITTQLQGCGSPQLAYLGELLIPGDT